MIKPKESDICHQANSFVPNASNDADDVEQTIKRLLEMGRLTTRQIAEKTYRGNRESEGFLNWWRYVETLRVQVVQQER